MSVMTISIFYKRDQLFIIYNFELIYILALNI